MGTKAGPRTAILNGQARMHESAKNVGGGSTGEPTASGEAVDGDVFLEYRLVVRQQALEATKRL